MQIFISYGKNILKQEAIGLTHTHKDNQNGSLESKLTVLQNRKKIFTLPVARPSFTAGFWHKISAQPISIPLISFKKKENKTYQALS